MKLLYEAQGTVEAYMLKHLMEEHEIQVHIHGEHLVGGVGELPAQGLVRIFVEDEYQDNAEIVLQDWLASWQEPSKAENYSTTPPSAFSFSSFFLGAIVGAIGLFFVVATPVEQGGFDYNRDGVPDEVYSFNGDKLRKYAIDRNFDGVMDSSIYYGRDGQVKRYQEDVDFDGRFETKGFYLRGVISLIRTDADGDGHDERISRMQHGNLDTISFYDSKRDALNKVQYFKKDAIVRAELDSNQDGKLDTIIEYDELEEESSRISKLVD